MIHDLKTDKISVTIPKWYFAKIDMYRVYGLNSPAISLYNTYIYT